MQWLERMLRKLPQKKRLWNSLLIFGALTVVVAALVTVGIFPTHNETNPKPKPNDQDLTNLDDSKAVGSLANVATPVGTSYVSEVHSPLVGGKVTTHLITNIQVSENCFVWNENTSSFNFTPSTEDVFPFRVQFIAKNGTHELKQNVTFEPRHSLPPEQNLISSQRSSVDPTRYTSKSWHWNDEKIFNTQKHKTRSVTISGFKVHLDCDYLEDLNGQPNIEHFSVQAEEIVIACTIKLPQTQVYFQAQTIVFDGSSGCAQVDTTPFSYQAEPLPAQSGDAGMPGGNITVIAETIVATHEVQNCNRFITNGGKGQQGGKSMPGSYGYNMTVFHAVGGMSFTWDAVYAEYAHVHPENNDVVGTKTWPTSGWNAGPAGVPGDGGRAGNINCSGPVCEFLRMHNASSMTGGLSGELGECAEGGKAGQPNPAYWVFCTNGHDHPDRNGCKVTHDHTQIDGNATTQRPGPNITQGEDGFLIRTTLKWHNLFALRSRMRYCVDLFAGDYFIEAAQCFHRLEFYLSEMDIADAEFTVLSASLMPRIAASLQLLASRLDIYGNPAGYVPQLSFVDNALLYESEVSHAMEQLYLYFWVTRKWEKLEQLKQGLHHTSQSLQQDIENSAEDLNAVINSIPVIQAEAKTIIGELEIAKQALQDKENLMMENARHNVEERHKVPVWKKTLRTLAKLAEVIPVYQPMLAGAGKIAEFVADNIDISHPLDDFYSKVPSLVDVLAGTNFSVQAVNFSKHWKNFTDEKWRDQAKDISSLMTKMQTLSKDVSSIFQNQAASADEVQKEYHRLLSESTDLKDEIEAIKKLTDKQAAIAAKLLPLLKLQTALPGEIMEKTVRLDIINSQISSLSDKLDHSIFDTMHNMHQDCRLRLQKWRYYLRKAYEFEFVEPFPINNDLEDLFEKILNFVDDENSTLPMPPEYFKKLQGIYDDDERRMYMKIAENIENRVEEQHAEIPFSLLPSDLQQLTAKKEFTLDLYPAGLFHTSQENIKIVNITLDNIDAHLEGSDSDRVHLLLIDVYNNEEGTLMKDGHLYKFIQRTNLPYSIAFHFKYDPITQKVTTDYPSPARESVIEFLFKDEIYKQEKKFLNIHRPAGMGKWTFRVSTLGDTIISINALEFTLHYDYDPHDLQQYVMDVRVSPENARPYIRVSQNDLNGKKDSYGPMLRIFDSGLISLEAAPLEGERVFSHWAERPGGQLVSQSRNISVVLDNALQRGLTAVYV